MRAIQRLMGALCFSRRAAAGRPNPYADLMAEDLWGNLGASVSVQLLGLELRAAHGPARHCHIIALASRMGVPLQLAVSCASAACCWD